MFKLKGFAKYLLIRGGNFTMIEARKTEFIRYLLSEGIGREWTGVGRCRHR